MTPSFLTRSLAACLLGATLLPAAGCDKLEELNAPSKEVQEARIRGRDEAIFRNFTKMSDCGALLDKEERFGCADFISHMDDKEE